MSEQYTFREARKIEVPFVFRLILQRIEWMDKKNIKQWNVTKYMEVYPETYYETARLKRELFVLEDTQSKEVVCAAVLKRQDNRWHDGNKALYLHNFVSKVGIGGVGTLFLQKVESYAIENDIWLLRLDSDESNKSLAAYYEAYGFDTVGTCEDGLYKGILRQKQLVR